MMVPPAEVAAGPTVAAVPAPEIRLRRDAHLNDEAAQTVVNHVAMMGSSPEGIERAVAELDGLVARGLGQERLSAVRELLRQVAAEVF